MSGPMAFFVACLVIAAGATWSATRARRSREVTGWRVLQDANGLFYLQWHRHGGWFYERQLDYDGFFGEPKKWGSQAEVEHFVTQRQDRELFNRRAEERKVIKEVSGVV